MTIAELRNKNILTEKGFRSLYMLLYKRAYNAIHRCADVDNKYYGGRGIKVEEMWVQYPDDFILYMASLPGHDDWNLVLDRINNDGNYEPGNLRFATHSESGKNTRQLTGQNCYQKIGTKYRRKLLELHKEKYSACLSSMLKYIVEARAYGQTTIETASILGVPNSRITYMERKAVKQMLAIARIVQKWEEAKVC